MPSDRIRSFIALPMPEDVQRYLYALQRRLNNAAPDAVRWVGADGMHLTLKFLGDILPAQVPAIATLVEQAALQTPPLRLPLNTMGCFPTPLRPRVLWAGLGGDLSHLQALHAAIDTGVTTLGFEPETRPFAPHITLGRVPDSIPPDDIGSLRRMLESPPVLSGAPLALVERLVLYQSTLTQAGPIYQHLADVPLTGA